MAVGHFNVADLVLLKAVFASARELNVPVLVGASDGEREFMGVPQIATLVFSCGNNRRSTGFWRTSSALQDIDNSVLILVML